MRQRNWDIFVALLKIYRAWDPPYATRIEKLDLYGIQSCTELIRKVQYPEYALISRTFFFLLQLCAFQNLELIAVQR